MGLDIKYINCSPQNLKTDKKFKVILNMEIEEHVSDVNLFMQKCSSLIEKDGIMFVATINKNLKSYLFAIIGACPPASCTISGAGVYVKCLCVLISAAIGSICID